MDVDVPSASGNPVNGGPDSLKNADGASDHEIGEEEEEPESEEAESEEDKNTESESDGESDRHRRQSKKKEVTKPGVSGESKRPWPTRRGPFSRRNLGFPRPRFSHRITPIDEDEAADLAPAENDRAKTEDEEESEKEEKEDGESDTLDPPDDQDFTETTPTADDYAPVISSATLKAATSPPKASSRVVDHTGPLIASIAPIAAAAAASSIMAGSEVVNFPSPGTSTSSRSQSPEPGPAKDASASKKKKIAKVSKTDDDCDDKTSDSIAEKDKPPKQVPPPLDMDVDAAEVEVEADNEPSAEADADEPENEQEPEAEVENEVEPEVEAEEPIADDDLEVELESDLQPAHRAEALDVLATIELKFALLRERVYVEKMEGLAWEEKLVNEGTHPELIHIQKELLKRRDKRLELASRKREYELANIAKKRRVNEDITWSWWKLARDELQTDMVAESSRKRRRLERERRVLERPQPVRRIPMPPSEVPPAPSLRKIVKNFPFAEKQKSSGSQSVPKQGAYPELSGLSPSEINADLEIFFTHRRYGYRGEPFIGVQAQITPAMGFGGYDAYPEHAGNPMAPTGRIPPQHAPPFAHQMQPPPGYAYPPNNGRMPPPPSHGHGHPPLHGGPPGPGMYPDELMGVMPQPPPPHHYYGSQVNGGVYPDGVPPPGPPMSGPPGHHGRRSPSPMNGVMNGKHGGWIGPGIPPGAGPAPIGSGGYPGQGRPQKGEWLPDERRREYPIGSEEEERERMMMMKEREQREKRETMERERDRERDRELRDRDRDGMPMDIDRERERHMHMMAHRQGPPLLGPPGSGPPPSSMHPHSHSMPPVPHHHMPSGHHHPRHHHHVVHYHHGQPSGPGGPPPGSAIHSPRSTREYGEIRPGSGHGQFPTEVINLSSKHGPPPPRDDYPMGHKERPRISRRSSPVPGHSQSHPPNSGPVGTGPPPTPGMETDRLIPTPFVMASTQAMQATSVNGTSSPRVPSGYDGHVRSPNHRFSSVARSAPPTAGPSTPAAGPPLSIPPSAGSGNREGLAMSPPRRPPPQSPTLLNEREREPPPPPLPSSISERDRMPIGSSASVRSPSVGYKRPNSPVGQSGKASTSQPPLVSPRIGLAGPGRAVTPAGPEGRGASFASPSTRSVNGGPAASEGEDRESVVKDKERIVVDAKVIAGPGVPPAPPPVSSSTMNAATNSPMTLPPPSKLSVAQMVDGP
ncbi:hypothetical protein AN958_05253 [Leucoagaricus sp. SymC.cos]|nr:hypothetical protein AN958_05253 [Leucoagaricus sp. SymC.cos]